MARGYWQTALILYLPPAPTLTIQLDICILRTTFCYINLIVKFYLNHNLGFSRLVLQMSQSQSELVRDARLTTKLDPDRTTHTFLESSHIAGLAGRRALDVESATKYGRDKGILVLGLLAQYG